MTLSAAYFALGVVSTLLAVQVVLVALLERKSR